MAPKNMRGLVSALNLLASAFAYAFGLAFAGLIKDPYITWDFGGPAILGFVTAFIFWWIYRGLDDEEYHLTENGDYQARLKMEKEDADARETSNASLSEKDEKSVPPVKISDKEIEA